MNDTISRQVAIDALTDKNIIEHMDSVYDSELHRFKRATERIIAQLPPAQPERTGKWIYDNALKYFFCSECGEPSLTDDDRYIYGMDLPNFCPNCGARMEEGGK